MNRGINEEFFKAIATFTGVFILTSILAVSLIVSCDGYQTKGLSIGAIDIVYVIMHLVWYGLIIIAVYNIKNIFNFIFPKC